MAWGDKDPWEPIELGKAYANFDCVEDFVTLPDVGHCPQVSLFHLTTKTTCEEFLTNFRFLCISSHLTELFVCMKDEAPQLINLLVTSFVARHAPQDKHANFSPFAS